MRNHLEETERDAYLEDETVREIVDAHLLVARSIQSELGKDASEGEKHFAKVFDQYAMTKIKSIAPKFWERIKEDEVNSPVHKKP